jgi:type IV pilus assembly protein PilB
MPLTVCVSTERDIIEAYRVHYRISDEEYQQLLEHQVDRKRDEEIPITQIDDFGALASEAAEGMELETFEEERIRDQYSATDAPIIKLVNGILTKAFRTGSATFISNPTSKTCRCVTAWTDRSTSP